MMACIKCSTLIARQLDAAMHCICRKIHNALTEKDHLNFSGMNLVVRSFVNHDTLGLMADCTNAD
jgi:hypothetical protein